jgi:hypothetical protein
MLMQLPQVSRWDGAVGDIRGLVLVVEGLPVQPAPAGPPTPLMHVKAAGVVNRSYCKGECCGTIISPGLAP